MVNTFSPVTALITNPSLAFKRMSLILPTTTALAVFGVSLLSVLGHLFASQPEIYTGNPAVFLMEALYILPSVVIGLLLLSAVVHLSADLLGGAGRGRTLVFFFMFATLPLWLIGPSALLVKNVIASPGLYPFVFGTLALWSTLLAVSAIRELYRFSFWRAVSALLLPCLVLCVLSILVLMTGKQFVQPI